MDKSNTRARRNGHSLEKSAAAGPAGKTEAESPVALAEPAGGEQGTTGTVAGEARQRLEKAGGNTAGCLRRLQDTFIDERNDVLAVINELEDQLDRQHELRQTLERQLSTVAEQLQSAKQRAQELEWQVVTLQTRVDALEHLRHDVASLEEELNDEKVRSKQANERLSAVENERQRLAAELKGLNKQLDEFWAVRKERDGLRADYRTLSAKVEELERGQREILEERSRLTAQLQDTRASLDEVTAERSQLVVALRGTEDRIRELTQVQAALEEKIEVLREEKKTLQAQITHLERENARLIDQRQFYECEVTALRNQNRTAEAALTSIKRAFGEVRIALSETKARARRRSLDTWPRVGTPLRGIPGAEAAENPATSPTAVALGAEQVLAEAEALMPAANSAARGERAEVEQERSNANSTG